jgi:Tfp pilus tip-associated adhesin PilY1
MTQSRPVPDHGLQWVCAACAGTNGWVFDLPDSGERVNIDPKLQLGTLTFASNVPSNSACSIGGHSWLNFVDFRTGLAVATSPDAGGLKTFERNPGGGSQLRASDGWADRG